MNLLVKKEVRLILPSWVAAMFLALIQAVTRPYDFYIASLLFLGMTMMALSSIGRETSLNTFSTMLAQPAERIRLWQTKLSVLAGAFLSVFGTWFVAYLYALWRSAGDQSGNSYNLFITVCLIATATFTGGLWAALLFRQLAGAFWLTLLVPATLCGFVGGFLSVSQTDNGVIAGLCICLGVYSIGGFFYARWLFFRAQDVGWTGGVITLPELKIFSRHHEGTQEIRRRRPLAALVKKEIQLQQVSLLGASGLLVLHVGVVTLRNFHKFPANSAGEILTTIFWMLWLVLPAVVGAMAIAEERRLGVMEGQLCLPASRRMQFVIKGLLTLILGVFLGGAMPWLVEMAGGGFRMGHMSMDENIAMSLGFFGFSLWLSLVSFFASSLAKNFLQAVGYGLTTFVVSAVVFPVFADGRMIFFDRLPTHTFLPLIIAGPTLAVTMVWLAYWNYKNFRDGWQALWRSSLVFVGAMIFVAVSSSAIYNRAWEAFEPAEPAHGPAKLTLANPPTLHVIGYTENILVKLPDGRVWFDFLADRNLGSRAGRWAVLRQALLPAMPESGGPQRFLSGANWVSAMAERIDTWVEDKTLDKDQERKPNIHVFGYTESFGVQQDGTLWVSDKSDQNQWTADKLTQFGEATDWQDAAAYDRIGTVLLLKKNGTLWEWGRGTNRFDWKQWPQNWPGLRAFEPHQIGTASDWKEFFSDHQPNVKKTDGSVWEVWSGGLTHLTNYDQIPARDKHTGSGQYGACVREDGTLWIYGDIHNRGRDEFDMQQTGHDTNWVSVAVSWEGMVALKTDGTLWKWDTHYRMFAEAFAVPPTRLGIHADWVALAGAQGGVISMAADGSLWYWPFQGDYRYSDALMRLPKQPRLLGYVLVRPQ